MVAYPITAPAANQKTRVGWAQDITAAVNDHEIRITAVESVTVVKTADETVNNSAVYQNDDHLFKAVLANTTYKCNLDIQFSSTAVANFKIDFTIPAGATIYVPSFHATIAYNVAGPNCAVTGVSGVGAGVPLPFRAWFTLVVGATAGTLQLRWAQNTAQVSNTVVYLGSSLQVFPV